DPEHAARFRPTFAYLPDDGRLLVVALHHLVCDAHSFNGPFLREMYADDPKELPIGYADYAVWERRPERDEQLARQVEAWRERLEAAPPPLRLFPDRLRPARPAALARTHQARLDAGVAAAAATTAQAAAAAD